MKGFLRLVLPSFTFATISVVVFPCVLVAHGYATDDNSGVTAPNFGKLLQPIENFVSDMGAIQSKAVPMTNFDQPRALLEKQSAPIVTAGIHTGFERFDAWVYGAVGFHIIGLFTAILGIFSGILGAVKNATDWMLGAI